MADLEKYRQSIQKVLTEYAKKRSSVNEKFEAKTIFDKEQDRYQLIFIGWRNENRIFGPVLHFEIENEKIWIQWNRTEEDVADELVKMGVLKEDIVLGFQPPYMRQYTEYAVG
ncbi:XisI protein [Argonema galeatum]|uniref:XisI protein n=1 Tax=Argonema galeatum TaxID=2942762 RepID=UPI0020137B59|nr:XisI protein [Argonema galeatum]MCL1463143.1 XisI protein [Argonema galeatum A003/A1]